MATKSAVLSFILQRLTDVGATPTEDLDEELTISGFSNVSVTEYTLANAAEDEVFTLLGNLSGLLVYSRDYVFKLRLAEDETQIGNGRLFVAWGEEEDEVTVPDGTLLLTGNGSNDSNLLIFQVLSTTT